MKKKLGLFLPEVSSDYNKVSASIWIRALQMVKHYQKSGFDVRINNPFRLYDIAIVYRLATKKNLLLCKALRKTAKKVYFDSVVNYFVEHSGCNTEQVYYQKKIAEVCDGLICSTENIASYAKRFNSNIHIMDDPIDTEYFHLQKSNINYHNPIFGWSGVSSKALFLNKYANIIDNKVVLICDGKIHNQKIDFNFTYIPWRYETFSKHLVDCDIAFLPRTYIDDPYNLGHSSFKALVFAITGIPIIANKLPSYEKLASLYESIVFLEENADDIDSCINKLIAKPAPDITKIRSFYSCENQALRLRDFFFNEKTI